MKIGNVHLANPVFTAPMAGITDKAFREILARQKPGLVMTEMLSDQALLYENEKTLRLLDLSGENYPIGVQLCGSRPEYMAKAARIAAAQGPVLIDINMGCPAPKIVKNGEGSSLLRNPTLAAEIVSAVKEAVDIPVTVKIRKGWSKEEESFLQIAERLVKAGAAAITLHGRYREQFYHGEADWQSIARLVAAVSVPVIGNGDIFSAPDAARMLRETHCAAVMIGRGMLGNPWLVGETVLLLQEGRPKASARMDELFATMRGHVTRQIELWGEAKGVSQMRKHLAWYVKGLPLAAEFRRQVNNCLSGQEVLAVLSNYEQDIARRRLGG